MTLALDVLLSDTGAIARRLSGFEVRPQQMLMAGAVERAFEERQRLFVEAGTGVGKSFAYLLPAIRRIVERGERVVVATNTISLQEQLIEKDIPLLNAVIPEEFSAVRCRAMPTTAWAAAAPRSTSASTRRRAGAWRTGSSSSRTTRCSSRTSPCARARARRAACCRRTTT
ncbi:MAG: DEAD/DEAH box helicase [Proteobacteria bacterium]|nr:DEAD/DEAH box helicase [Pseudomonadota bacterium]